MRPINPCALATAPVPARNTCTSLIAGIGNERTNQTRLPNLEKINEAARRRHRAISRPFIDPEHALPVGSGIGFVGTLERT
jgi:hypothetical protein